jgi:hypothetical protein
VACRSQPRQSVGRPQSLSKRPVGKRASGRSALMTPTTMSGGARASRMTAEILCLFHRAIRGRANKEYSGPEGIRRKLHKSPTLRGIETRATTQSEHARLIRATAMARPP